MRKTSAPRLYQMEPSTFNIDQGKKMDDSHTAVCVKKMRRAVVPAVVVSHRTNTRSRHAYRFSLSHTRYPLIVPTIVMRNRLCTAHPSFQGESVSS
jgi:hypothetical protein